jgi:hypothetical protein
MNLRLPYLLLFVCAVLLLPKSPLLANWLPAATPITSAFTYQGHLLDDGQPANGDYTFYFLLFDAEVDGAQVGATIKLPKVSVVDGRFTVHLDFGGAVWNGEARWLETQVNGTPLTPRQSIGSVPYATYAQAAPWSGLTHRPAGLDDGDNDTTYSAGNGLTLSGTQFNAAGAPYANVVVVAKSGGDFTSVGAALASIQDAAAANPYLVWVAPGVYTETITMKSYVDIVGAGEDRTVLATRHVDPNAVSPIVTGADAAALRDLTVKLTVDFPSQGAGSSVAITSDTVAPTFAQVTVWVKGMRGSSATGISTRDGGGQYRDLRIYVECRETMSYCTGFTNLASASTLAHSTIVVTGATTRNTGISHSSGTLPGWLEVDDSAITAIGRADPNVLSQVSGIAVGGGASLTMRHSTVAASGGIHSNYGISTDDVNGVGQKQIRLDQSAIDSTASPQTASNHALRLSHLTLYTVRLGATRLGGDVQRGIADLACVHTYDADYAPLSALCQPLQ